MLTVGRLFYTLPLRVAKLSVFELIILVSALIATGCNRGPDYYLRKGNQFFEAHKYDDAALQYQKALQKDANWGEALYRLGLTKFEQNAFASAYPLLLRAVDRMPQNADARIKLADVSLALYMSSPSHPRVLYDPVTKAVDDLLARDPKSFDALRLKGELLLLDGNPKEAIDHFHKANAIRPMQPDVIVGLVQALMVDKQAQVGEQLAHALIQREPSFGPIYDVLYNHYRSSGQLADAEKLLKAKVATNPSQAEFRLQLASHYARQQNRVETAAALQSILSDTKRFPDGALLVGDFYAHMGNWAEAQRQYEDGARNHSNALGYQKKIIDALLMQGKKADAARIVDTVIKDHPADVDISTARASLRMESGKPEDVDAALSEFGSLVKAAPNDARLRYDYGRCWSLKGDFGHAQTEFREAVRAQHDLVPALYALAKINLTQHRVEDALRYTQQILAYEPNNVDARQLGIDVLMDAGRLVEAQRELDVLLREYPENRNVQLQLGFLRLAQKNFREAEKIFQGLDGANGSNVPSMAGLTQLYSDEKQFDKALKMLSEASKRSPNSIAIQTLLATTAVRARKYDLAVSTYEELISRQPKSSELYTRLGKVYLAKGDNNSAAKTFEKAKELAPSQALPVTLLAISLDGAQRHEEAKRNYKRALQLDPENPAILNNLAFLLAEGGSDLDDALRMVQHALQKQPLNPAFADTLGYVYLKKKLTGSAIQTYSSLVRRYPNNSTFHYHLGMSLLENGDRARAKVEFQNALANHPSHQDEVNIRDQLRTLGT